MKNKFLIIFLCVLTMGIFDTISTEAHNNTIIFKEVDLSDSSNAVLAIKKGVSVGSFLKELFLMSFSENSIHQRFGGMNIADIAAGSLVYSEEFYVSRSDWDSLVDAFLISGILTESNERYQKGFEILLWQRNTPTVVEFIKKIKLEKPLEMKETDD